MFIKQITYIAQLYILAKNELAKLASSKIHVMPGLDCRLLRSTPLSQSIAFTMESGCPKLTVLHKLLVHIYFPYKIQTRPRARRTHPPTSPSPSRHPGSAGTSPRPSSACRSMPSCTPIRQFVRSVGGDDPACRPSVPPTRPGHRCVPSAVVVRRSGLPLRDTQPRRQQDGHTCTAAIRICSSII